MHMNKSFLTGSRAYGKPRPDSDIDLVMRICSDDLDKLKCSGVCDSFYDYPENDGSSLKFGKLNLICVTTDVKFEAWAEGTVNLIARAPVSREDAIAHFATKGIEPNHYNETIVEDETPQSDPFPDRLIPIHIQSDPHSPDCTGCDDCIPF